MPSVLEVPRVNVKVNGVPLLLCNTWADQISERFNGAVFFTTSSAFSNQVEKPSIHPVNVSIMTNMYFYP